MIITGQPDTGYQMRNLITDLEKFDELSLKLGGRFRATAVIQKRLKDILASGSVKDVFHADTSNLISMVIDELLSGETVVKEVATEGGREATRKDV